MRNAGWRVCSHERKGWGSSVSLDDDLVAQWRETFFDVVKSTKFAPGLRQAAIGGELARWTESLTGAVVRVCESHGWVAAAKAHEIDLLPVARFEYLGIDVMAFRNGTVSWPFPVAAIELENSRNDDHIAYSLWKVLNLRTELRLVFCYRPSPEAGPELVRHLNESVIGSLSVKDRTGLGGDTAIVVGYRNNAETFPFGFFKWWRLNANIGRFELL